MIFKEVEELCAKIKDLREEHFRNKKRSISKTLSHKSPIKKISLSNQKGVGYYFGILSFSHGQLRGSPWASFQYRSLKIDEKNPFSRSVRKTNLFKYSWHLKLTT